MMKKYKIPVLAVTAMLTITGCGAENPPSQTVTPSEAAVAEMEATTSGDVKKETNTEQNEKNNDLIQLTDNLTYDSYQTENGRYSLMEREDEEGNIVKCIAYVDYETAQQILLCNKPNCKHDSEDCSAVIPEEMQMFQQAYLFGDEQYLYLAASPYDNAGTTTVQTGSDTGEISFSTGADTPPTVYRMNPDGTKREKLYTLQDGTVLEGQFFQDDNYFYTVTKKLESETEGNTTYTTGYDKKVIRINMESGKVEDVLSLDTDAVILGCYGRNLVLGVIDYGKELTPQEINDTNTYKEMYENSIYKITSVNVDTKEVTPVKEIKQSQLHSELVKDGYLYISYEKDTGIHKMDLVAGKETTIPTEKNYCIEYEIDGTLLGQEWNAAETYHYDFIDSETGEIKECTLQTSEGTPVTIVSENRDSLFVWYDYVNEDEYVPWMDVTQEVIGETHYGIIKKSDYLNNVGNYQEVAMLEVE